MKRFISIIAIAVFIPFCAFTQDMADALRYSNFQVQGTARAGGMGNAFGALGGDFTSLSINPAGLGLYRSSEFAISPLFNQSKIESSFLGSSSSDSKYSFGFNNLSYVGVLDLGNKSSSGLVSVNFGVGFNKLKDFNSNFVAEGANAKSSYLDYFADRANNGKWSDFYEELAWKTDILIYDNNKKEYYHDIMDNGYGQTQGRTTSRSGSINEYTLSLGLNFNHRLYMGASLGIMDVYYKENTDVYEVDKKNNIPYLNDFNFSSGLRTVGNGYNVKLGVIFKPTNSLRIGAAVHSPTFYSLNDQFETSMKSYLTYKDGSKNYTEKSPLSEYNYKLETPLRATLSAAYVIGKKGLVSADYELVDYSTNKLREGGDGYTFKDENKNIAEAYKTTGNLRLGGEYKLTSTVGLRAGYELYQSPYNENAFGTTQPNAGLGTNVISAGLGYRSGGFFFDMAYRLTNKTENEYIYPAPSNAYPEPALIENKIKNSDILFTLGFRF